MRIRHSWAVAVSLLVGCGGAPVAELAVASSQPPDPGRMMVATTSSAVAAASSAPVAVLDLPKAPTVQTSIDATSSPSIIGIGKEQELFVRVRVKGLPIEDKRRPPINIALVVDVSGSMDGAPIERAREACATLVDALSDGDTMSIVAFGSAPTVVVESSVVSAESKAAAKKKIAAMVASGTTDLAGGLRVGLEQARARLAQKGINRVVLVGDGAPNDPAAALAFADQAKAQRIAVTSLGLGYDFDETFMTQLAQRSGGAFHFIDDSAKVASVFREEIAKMERLVAKNTWVEVTPGPGVTIVDAIGQPRSVVGRSLRIQVGDVTEGQTRDFVVRVRATGKRDGGTVELLDAVVHHTLPEGGSELTASKFSSIKASADAAALKDAAVVDVDRQATRLLVADGIVRSIALARAGDVLGARKLLGTTQKLANDGAKKYDDADLRTKSKEIDSLKKTIATLAPPPEPRFGFDQGGGAMMKRPTAAKMASPAEAMEMRSMHGAAMRDLQSE